MARGALISHRARRAIAAVPLSALLLGCGANGDAEVWGDGGEVQPPRATAIQGGYVDATSAAVVAIVREGATPGAQALCSGVLMAPNVVLTARHCVAASSDGGQGVRCDEALFAQPHPATSFRVTTAVQPGQDDETPAGEVVFAVAQVVVPDGRWVCGGDIALLRLASAVPAATARPLVPRFDEPPLRVGEGYSAVGYGAADGSGQGSGVRRRRDDLAVVCAADCAGATALGDELAQGEWVGDGGVCEGDSGGPSLDGSERISGVTSRGAGDCSLSVYTGLTAHQVWLQDAVADAAVQGGFAAPAWTGPPAEAEAPGGCSLAAAPNAAADRGGRGGPFWALLLALMAVAGRRRRGVG